VNRSLLSAALGLSLFACAAARPVPGSVSAVRHTSLRGIDLVDEIVSLKTRGEITQSYLLATQGGSQPRAVALAFPGGPGVVGLPADVNQLEPQQYFVSRAQDLLRDREVAVAVMDVPSDRQAGLDDEFRSGREHLHDVTAVVGDLRRRFPGAKIFLLGTSRGTVSAAHLGRELGSQVAGVIMASTVFSGTRRYPGLGDFDFRSIASPLLFVHHARDRCPLCPYSAAKKVSARYPLITVNGGKRAESDGCGPLSPHGYYGKEAETAAAIKSWMLGRPYPSSVE
jgi:Serine aminopeptidase, S33